MKKSILHLLAAALVLVFALGCNKGGGGGSSGGSAAGSSNVVKIVSSLPRTGSANAQTTTMVNGIRMAIDEAGGKVGDFTIVYEDWDDASAKKGDWDPEVEAANADKAVKDPDVLFYIGTYNSGAAKISMPVLNRAGLVMISPANTATGLTKPGMGEPNEPDIYRPSGKISYFRVVPADDIQGRVGAEWMKQLGGKSVYVLDDRGVYGKGIADVFNATAEQIGLKVLGREGIDPKAQEYKCLMTKIKERESRLGLLRRHHADQRRPDRQGHGGGRPPLEAHGARRLLRGRVHHGCRRRERQRPRVHHLRRPAAGETHRQGRRFVHEISRALQGAPEAYAVYGYVAARSRSTH